MTGHGIPNGPAYTLRASGTTLAFELGAHAVDDNGRSVAPVDVVLETDSRKPAEKHAILDHGADPNARASLRKQLHPGYGPETMHEYRDVTPLGWGERFHREIFVSRAAMRLIAEYEGRSRK